MFFQWLQFEMLHYFSNYFRKHQDCNFLNAHILQSWSVLDFWRTNMKLGWSARIIDFFHRMMMMAVLRSWAVTKYLLKMDEPSELWRVGVKVWSGIGSCPPYISLVLLNMSPTDCSSASFLDIFLLSAGNLTWFTEHQMNSIHTPPSSDDFQSTFSCINLPNAFTKTLQR